MYVVFTTKTSAVCMYVHILSIAVCIVQYSYSILCGTYTKSCILLFRPDVHTAFRSDPAGYLLHLRAVSVHDRGLSHAHAAAALPHKAVCDHWGRLHGARGCRLGCIQAAKSAVRIKMSSYIHTNTHLFIHNITYILHI